MSQIFIIYGFKNPRKAYRVVSFLKWECKTETKRSFKSLAMPQNRIASQQIEKKESHLVQKKNN